MDKTDALKPSGEKIESVYVTLTKIVKYHISYALCCDSEQDALYWKFFFNELNKHICFTITILYDFINTHSEQEIINLILEAIVKEIKND